MEEKLSGHTAMEQQISYYQRRIQELEKELAEKQQAYHSEYGTSKFLQFVIDSFKEYICVLDKEGIIIAVNKAWHEFAATNPPIINNIAVGDNYLAACDSAQGTYAEIAKQVASAVRAIIRGEYNEFSIDYPCYYSPDKQRWFAAHIIGSPDHDAIRILAIHKDITDSKNFVDAYQMNEMRLNSLLNLALQTHGTSEKEIIINALEEAVKLTRSKIGYLHFFNEDEETVQLTAWSKETLKKCTAVYEQHYPLSKAGVWADCARIRKPVLHNDYPNLPNKQGLPEGHSELIRHLSVPVIEDNKIRIIIGVGNKESNYDETDIKQLQLLANTIYLIIQRRRALVELQKLVSIVETSSDFICILDLDGKVFYMNEAGRELVGFHIHPFIEKRDFEEFIMPEDKETSSRELHQAISKKGSWTGELRLRNISNGLAIPVDIKAFQIGDPETGQPIAIATICRDITERKKTEIMLQEMARLDPLTGILNRRHFFDLAFESFKQAYRYSWNLSVLMIDIDNFKSINDKYGHAAGDRALISVVERLKLHLRDSDIFSRYGGEEFIILMPATDKRSASLAAERLRLAIAEDKFKANNDTVTITISVGIASLDKNRDFSIDDLVKRADEALYQAKLAGKNCVC